MTDKNQTLEELSELFREQQEQFAADMENANETGMLLFTLINHYQERSESLMADMIQLRDALQTLASTEPIGPHGYEPNTAEGKEVMARIDHARAALTGSKQRGFKGKEVGKSDITRRVKSDIETRGDDLDSSTQLTWLLKRIEAAGWPNLQGGKFEVWATVSHAQSELIDQRAQIGQLKQELEKLRPFQSAIERLSAEDDPIEDIQND